MFKRITKTAINDVKEVVKEELNGDDQSINRPVIASSFINERVLLNLIDPRNIAMIMMGVITIVAIRSK